MFGFACDETPELMPAPIQMAHQLARRLAVLRRDGTLRWARPDGKTQVSIEYDADGRPRRVDTVLVSVQHGEEVTQEQIFEDVQHHVVEKVIPAEWLDAGTKRYVNPTGRFVIGGPQADAGLTGRKIIVDTYGGYARHGGGAFSGKDPSKVDRSAAYGARWAAKNVVAAGLATKCEIQVAYAIGVAKPVSVLVETFGTEKVPNDVIASLIDEYIDLSPFGIMSALELRRPIYRQVAAYGHFGRSDLDLPWERTTLADQWAEDAGTEPLLTAAATASPGVGRTRRGPTHRRARRRQRYPALAAEPRSTPKHLLPLARGGETLLRATVDRVIGLGDSVRIVTAVDQIEGCMTALADLEAADDAFIAEPVARGTGPALGLAVGLIAREDPDALIASVHADHRVSDPAAYRAAVLASAGWAAATDGLATVGPRSRGARHRIRVRRGR